jgi:hypothetical protein
MVDGLVSQCPRDRAWQEGLNNARSTATASARLTASPAAIDAPAPRYHDTRTGPVSLSSTCRSLAGLRQAPLAALISDQDTPVAGVHVRGLFTYFAAREAACGPSRRPHNVAQVRCWSNRTSVHRPSRNQNLGDRRHAISPHQEGARYAASEAGCNMLLPSVGQPIPF